MLKYYFLGLLFSLNLMAQCENVDLNKDSVLKDIPITDQDGSGLCYAFSSSQLIEFQLRSDGYKGAFPSPIGISLDSGISSGLFWDSERDDIDGGDEEDVINYVKKNGFMDKECIEIGIKSMISESKITSSQFVAILHHFFNDSHFWLTDEEVIKTSVDKIVQSKKKKMCQSAEKELVEVLKLGNSVTSILKEMLASCYKKINKVKLPEFKTLSTGSDSGLINFLSKALSAKKPAAISVCAEVFTKDAARPKIVGIPSLLRGANGNLIPNACSPHAVLAVGKKMINGECNYLIRNSWGSQWNGEGKLKCACKSRTRYYEDCNEINDIKDVNLFFSEDIDKIYLGCWVKEKDLGPNLLSVGSF